MRHTDIIPQLSGPLFLTDGGLETDMIFNHGIELPCFSAINLMRTEYGRLKLQRYYSEYLGLARKNRAGFILESPTWRASTDWAEPMGLGQQELANLNRQAIRMLIRMKQDNISSIPVCVSGCIGPRGDGYVDELAMDPAAAYAYHAPQIKLLADSGVDVVSALTMTNINEALGITQAAADVGVPVVISFTVETDGRLSGGESLASAIAAVDTLSSVSPRYYMINCAHPEHFARIIDSGTRWARRIGGLRVNASRCSHQELDNSDTIDDGNPEELAHDVAAVVELMPWLAVIGGCCGTDYRHIRAISSQLDFVA